MIARSTQKSLAAGLLILLLGACEAELDLDGLEAERGKALKRFDQFQGVSRSGSTFAAVGVRGVAVISQDGGTSWIRSELRYEDTPVTPTLIDIVTCPDGNFVALDAGRHIWRSDSFGATWTSRELPSSEVPLAIECDPSGRLWVVGSFSTISSSTDLGESWNETSLDEDLILTTVQFIDASHAVITGEFGTFLSSDDGGASWQNEHVIPNDFYPQAAYFASAEEGWVAGLNGKILHTVDRGANWSREETGVDAPLYGFVSGRDGLFAVGSFGTILRRDGDRWHATPGQAGPAYLRGAVVLDNGELLVAGGGGTLQRVVPGVVPGRDGS